MSAEERTVPETEGDDMVEVKPQMVTGPAASDKVSQYSCKLSPEIEVTGGPILPFVTVYDRRSAEYNTIKLCFEKIKVDQLNIFQHLVRMEIQYLAGCNIVWKSSGPDLAPKPRAARGATGGAGAGVDYSLVPPALDSLATAAVALSAAPAPAAAAARPAGGGAPAPAAAAAAARPAGGGAGSATNLDFSDIVNWDYRSGFFPLTDEALRQLVFPEDLAKPKHYYALAVLLYVREARTQEEENAFQRLNSAWLGWYDGKPISYEAFRNGPPTAPPRYAYSPEEINWCKTKLTFLDRAIKDVDARERFGLDPLTKQKDASAAGKVSRLRQVEADALLGTGGSSKSPAQAGRSPSQAVTPRDSGVILTATPSPGETTAVKKRRRTSTKDATPKESETVDAAGQVEDTRTVLKDGKLVSSKDGRAAAAGNTLKLRFPNTYRNHENDNLFYGKALTLGEEHALFSTRMTSAYLLTSLAIIR